MLIELWRYIKGYLVIRAEGKDTERFINLAITRGIYFWDLRRRYRGATFKMPVKTFKKTRPLARRTRCRLSIHRKVGGPFILQKARRRKGFVLGGMVFALILYLFSSFIWYIEVTGLDNIEEEEVLEITRSLGVAPGSYKGGLDWKKLEKEVARLHEDIVWASVSSRGISLHIEIAEHVPEPEIEKEPSDLVAEKDGLILKVSVVEGTPQVTAGDVVAKGDVLIEGVKDYDEEFLKEMEREDEERDEEIDREDENEEEGFKPEKVRARGEVEARVWYEARGPVEKKRLLKNPTGNEYSYTYVLWNSKKFNLRGSSEIPFPHYTREVMKRSWSWRNLKLPVELVTITFNELNIEEENYTKEEALERAKKLAKKAVLSQIPRDAHRERIFFEENRDEEKWEIRVVAETREDIAAYPE